MAISCGCNDTRVNHCAIKIIVQYLPKLGERSFREALGFFFFLKQYPRYSQAFLSQEFYPKFSDSSVLSFKMKFNQIYSINYFY